MKTTQEILTDAKKAKAVLLTLSTEEKNEALNSMADALIENCEKILEESVEAMEKVAEDNDITVFLSHAGEEVLKMYGLFERVKAVTGGRYRELAKDSEQKFSFPITGRLSLGKYDLLVVSPATANTVAKIVYGISDTLVTNVVAQAGKGRVKTYIVPVDIEEGDIETILPSKLELQNCKDCDICEAAEICPNEAIIPKEEIDLLKCIGCGLIINSWFSYIVNIGLVSKHIGYKWTRQLKDLSSVAMVSACIGLICYFIQQFFDMNMYAEGGSVFKIV